MVRAWEAGQEQATTWEGAATYASGLRVPGAVGDFLILRALRASGGGAVAADFRRAGTVLALLMGWGVAASAQEPRLLATEVAVARDEAALRLELSVGEPLEVVVAGGRVRLGDIARTADDGWTAGG